MISKTVLKNVVIDFVAQGSNETEWLVVLVEQGDIGMSEVSEFLLGLQDRLYNCLDVVIDGSLAEKFPKTIGGEVIIRLDCYNLPKEEVSDFFNSFSKGVLDIQDYKSAIMNNVFISDLSFEINFHQV